MQQAQLDLLVLAMQSGDQRALALLYRHFHRDLRRFAAYLLTNPAPAEDLVQNVWLKVSQRIGRLQDPAVFTSWLYRAVRWEVLDYQKHSTQRLTEQLAETHELVVSSTEPPDNALANAIARLPKLERDVVQLFYLHELSQQLYWGILLLLAFQAQVGTKLWIWLETNRSSTLREVKRLALKMQQLTEKTR